MVNIETIYMRIAECKACVNDEDGNFDELMEQVLADMLQVKELQEGSSCLPHVQLEESVWCDFLDCNIDAVFVGENDDWSSYELTKKDVQNIHDFLDNLDRQMPNGWTMDWENLDNPFFDTHPEFGLPCDCFKVRVYPLTK